MPYSFLIRWKPTPIQTPHRWNWSTADMLVQTLDKDYVFEMVFINLTKAGYVPVLEGLLAVSKGDDDE